MKLKVVQLNIWRGQVFDNLIDFIKEQDADILTLQEVYDGKDKSLPPDYRAFEYFKEEFPQYHAAFVGQFCDITSHGNIEEGHAILSKFPIKSTDTTFFDVPYATFDNHAKKRFDDNPQAVFHALVDANGTELNVYSVHGIWGFDGEDNERRLKMADILLKITLDKKNVIMAGDFNISPKTETVKKIGAKLKSVFGEDLIKTFNLKYKKNPGYATAAVDMMFVSPNISVLEKDSPDIDVSDHLPLVVTLEV